MSSPVIDPADLAVYLNDPGIDTDRAAALIADAQALCETIVSPLPAGAAVIVKRVAGNAYQGTASSRQAQLAAAGSPFAGPASGGGGVYLTRSDKADLRRFAGGSTAFSIDTLPTGTACVQTITVFGSPTSGSFVLNTAFGTTATITTAMNATSVQAILNAVPTLSAVTVAGAPGAWVVTFPSSLGPFPQMTVGSASFTGGTQPSVLVSTTVAGVYPPGFGLAPWNYATQWSTYGTVTP